MFLDEIFIKVISEIMLLRQKKIREYHGKHDYKCPNSLYPSVKSKRTKLELYFDVISELISQLSNDKKISKTRVQFKVNTSYDKLMIYLSEMEQKGLIISGKEIEITDKGREFYRMYSEVDELISDINKRIDG
jgi:predicted transcriptional regulator